MDCHWGERAVEAHTTVSSWLTGELPGLFPESSLRRELKGLLPIGLQLGCARAQILSPSEVISVKTPSLGTFLAT